jgi:homoserine kinase
MRIQVPATTANLGPGFDVLGLALSLYLTVDVEPTDGPSRITYAGQGEKAIPTDQTNLIWRTMAEMARSKEVNLPSFSMQIHNDIPLARGLGSSAAAIVAGVLIANQVCSLDLNEQQILSWASRLEGHPDNTTAAMMGGLMASCLAEDGRCFYTRAPISARIKAVVVVPEFELSTAEARRVLPASYSRADAVFNLQRAAMLAAALNEPQPALIAELMRDRFHQPYRAELIPGLQESLELRGVPGLLGISLSGAGPSILALALDHFEEIGQEIKTNFARHGIDSNVLVLEIEHRGGRVITTDP